MSRRNRLPAALAAALVYALPSFAFAPPKPAKPRTAKPRTAKRRTAKPRTARPKTAKPKTAKPRTATLTLTVDLDGKPPKETVRLMPDGTLRLLRGRRVLFRKKLETPVPAQASLRVNTSAIGTHFVVHIRAQKPGSRRALEAVLTRPMKGGRFKVLWSGPTGPVGRDAEYARRLSVGIRWILLYQTLPGLKRCDGRLPRLFIRMYDFKSGRFRPAAPTPGISGLPRLVASPAPPPGIAPYSVTGPTLSLLDFTFASTRLGEGNEAINLGPPKQLTDADALSAWVEGKGGAGKGEFLEARSPKTPYGIAAIRFIPGHAASRAAFTRHNRLRTFLVWLGPDRGYVVSVPADPAQSGKPPSTAYWVVLPRPVKTRCATVVLRSVYPGTSAGRGPGGQTAVSELTFLTELDLKGGIQRLLRDVDGRRVTQEQAVFYLRRLDKKASALLRRAFEKAGPRAKLALLQAFAERDPSKYVNVLVKGLPSAPPPLQVKLLVALARAGDAAVTPLSSLLKRKDVPGRLKAAVINTIGHIGTRNAALQLMAVFGRGHVKLRARAVKAAVQLKPEVLPINTVLTWPATARPAERADRIWLSGLVARRNPGSRMGVADTLVRVWPILKKFEPRFRLLQALGRTAGPTVAGSTGPAAQLSSRVEKLLTAAASATSEREELLRWAAVLTAGVWPSPGVSALLTRAASDPDPRVRLAALAGLAVRKHSAAAGLITRCIRKEVWPFVREGCLEALVRICPKGAAPHLARMARKGGSLRRAAMYALAACRYAGAGSVLARILRSKKSKPALAGYAAQLLAMVGDTKHAQFMLKIARKLSLAAAAHSGQEVLAIHLLESLATRASSKQLAHLKGPLLRLALQIPGKTRSRRVHNKAIEVLGKFCPPAAKPVLIKSLKSPSRIIVFNAHHALRRCGWSP